MTKKAKIITIILAAALACIAIILIVFLNKKSETVGPGNRPSSTLDATVTEISGDVFVCTVDAVSADKDFTQDNFKQGDSVTVRTKAGPTQGGFPNYISGTAYLEIGDRVEVVYNEDGFSLSDKVIADGELSWAHEDYLKKQQQFYGKNDK
ncbi:MAG: hypothetical protein IJ746_03170 [Ruminococcus sp.]|nr:hypothetical protein [Ruminococcus sp.]